MQNIQSLITNTIKSLYEVDFSPEISPAPKAELGEYCIGVFQLAKPVGKAPNIIAEELARELAKHTDVFVSTNSIGGYVNFFLTDSVWLSLFTDLSQSGEKPTNQQTIIVDYIGANVGKPLHIGHICTPSIGQTICNVYKHIGYNVIGDSHFGDWGGIFGGIICAWNTMMPNENREERLKTEWISYILELYQWFHDLGKDLIKTNLEVLWKSPEDTQKELEEWARKEFQYLSWVGIDLSNPEELNHHEENVELWKKFTAISIAETEKKLELLNVHAKYNIGESFYEGLHLPRPNNEDYPNLEYTMKDIVKELIAKGIATQNDDGSVGVIFPEETKIPSCVLQKKDGTGLYLTSDLAAIKYRLTNGWNPSKILYCVDVRQQLHLKQAFWIAHAAWPELGADNIEFFHAFNGFIKLKEGAMSTRHGTVIFLETLITEWFERTKKILEEKWRNLWKEDIQAITIAAIKYSYLAQDREKDVVFDWDKALSFEGNSGPYIQYAYVRAKKILPEGFVRSEIASTASLSPYDKSLIQTLRRMESIIQETAEKYKPHILALYCYDLAVAFNSFYVHTPKILEESNEELKQFRLTLCEQFVNQIRTGFELLGMKMPSEM